MRKFYICTVVVLLLLCGAGIGLLQWEVWAQAEPAAVLAVSLTDGLSPEQLDKERNLARWYNLTLWSKTNTEDISGAYGGLLDFGAGRMGYLVLASQEVLPIYHDGAEVGAVHWQGTSLPVGGIGNCPVLTCQGTVPAVGDVFEIRILDTVLLYEVAAVDSSGQYDFQKDLCMLVFSAEGERVYVTGVRLETDIRQQAKEESMDSP